MQVASDIFILKGIKRAAVYDYSKGLCWAAADYEVDLLERLSSPNFGSLPKGSTPILVLMRNRGWIIPGVPKPRDLTLKRMDRPKKPDQLENVWFELTNSCNLTCRHCYASSGPTADRSNELSVSDWHRIVDDVITLKPKKITFIGGEPTIRIDLVDELSKYILRSAPSVQLRMFSNLAIKSRISATLEVVARHGIEFGTAIYGMDPLTHDRMTGQIGSWEVTTEAIRECRRRSLDVFVGIYVDTRGLIDVRSYDDWALHMDVQRYEIIAPSKVGRGQSSDWQSSCTLNKVPEAMSFSSHQARVARGAHNCYFDHFVIRPDGIVSPCIMTRSVSYGHISQGVDSLLQSEEYQLAASISKDGIEGCSVCEFRYGCFDCRPDAMAGTNDWRKKPDCGYDPRLDIGSPL